MADDWQGWQQQRDEDKRAEREARKEANRATHAAKQEAWQEQRRVERERKTDPANDPHNIAMAKTLGIEPADFPEWQRQRQLEMAKIKPYEEQLADLAKKKAAELSALANSGGSGDD